MPGSVLTRADVVGRTVVDVMVAAGLQSSKGEARRLIKNRGANVNNAKVPAVDAVVGVADVIDGRLLLLGMGKKNKMLVWVVPSSWREWRCAGQRAVLWAMRRERRASVGSVTGTELAVTVAAGGTPPPLPTPAC